MNPTIIALVVVPTAVAAFFLSGRGARAWWTLLVALLAGAVGAGRVFLIEKGPQSAFARLPLSATHLAWLGSALALAGFGALAGLMARSCRDAIRK